MPKENRRIEKDGEALVTTFIWYFDGVIVSLNPANMEKFGQYNTENIIRIIQLSAIYFGLKELRRFSLKTAQ